MWVIEIRRARKKLLILETFALVQTLVEQPAAVTTTTTTAEELLHRITFMASE